MKDEEIRSDCHCLPEDVQCCIGNAALEKNVGLNANNRSSACRFQRMVNRNFTSLIFNFNGADEFAGTRNLTLG